MSSDPMQAAVKAMPKAMDVVAKNNPVPTPRPTPQGQTEAGNIDLHSRPIVKNPDGSISTVRSISITDDKGRAILIPTVVDGKVVDNKTAIDHWRKTGQHLGIFSNEAAADAYAQSLHEEQAKEYLPKASR